MTTLAILTCARKRDYLARTLESVGDIGRFGRLLIWCDGPVTLPRAALGWEVGGVGERQGPPNTFAFWDLLAAVDGDDLLFLEDDVIASPGAVTYAARMGCPAGMAYVSWFDPICRYGWRGLPAVRYINAGEVIGCPARTFPAETVRELLAFHGGPGWAPDCGSDVNIAAALKGRLAAVHVPSLFQHVGDVSEVSTGDALSGIRTSESWLGETYDVARGFAHVQPSDLWGAC
jgi:hypothetical protein